MSKYVLSNYFILKFGSFKTDNLHYDDGENIIIENKGTIIILCNDNLIYLTDSKVEAKHYSKYYSINMTICLSDWVDIKDKKYFLNKNKVEKQLLRIEKLNYL